MQVIQKSVLYLVIIIAVSIGMLGFGSPRVAHAATSCHASSCKNLDPTTTVGPDGVFCNKDAFLQEQDNVGNGFVQNWFSVNCDANWTVAQAPSGSSLDAVVMAVCQGTASGSTCNSTILWYTDSEPGFGCFSPIYVCNPGTFLDGTQHWFTNMVDGSQPVASAMELEDGSFHEGAFH